MSTKKRRKVAAVARDGALIVGVTVAGASGFWWDMAGIALLVAYASLVELLAE